MTGTGSAAMAAGSDRAAAEQTALNAALADARAQADAIAAATHLTISGVLAVSASVSPYFIYPLGVAEPATGGTSPGAVPPSIVSPPQGPSELSASATVEYSIH